MLLFVFVFGVVLPTLVTVACFVGFLVCWFHFRSRRRALIKKYGSRSRVHVTVPVRPTAVVGDPNNGLPTQMMCSGCRIFIDPGGGLRPARRRDGSVQSGRLLVTPPPPPAHLSSATDSTSGSEFADNVDEKHHARHHATTSTKAACRRTQYVEPPHRQHQMTSGTTVVEVHNGDDDNGYVLTEFIRPTSSAYETRSFQLSDVDEPSPLYDAEVSAEPGSSNYDYYIPTSSDGLVKLSATTSSTSSCDGVGKRAQIGGVRCTVVVRGGDVTNVSTGSVYSSGGTRRLSTTGSATSVTKELHEVSKSSTSVCSSNAMPQLGRQMQQSRSGDLDECGYVDVDKVERYIRLHTVDCKSDPDVTSTFSCSSAEASNEASADLTTSNADATLMTSSCAPSLPAGKAAEPVVT